MPRNVRNFWLELSVDGKRTDIATGPRTKDGGFDLRIAMRDEGGIIFPVRIHGRAHEGRIIMSASWDGAELTPIERKR